jgi:hypothetical protein
MQELLDCGLIAFNFNLYLAGGIAYPAGQVMNGSQTVDKRPESDPLHNAAHADNGSLFSY